MRALTLALISALALTACKKVDEGSSSAALPKVEAGQLSEATMKDVVKELSQDSYEGRAPGSPGEEKTFPRATLRQRKMVAGPRQCRLWRLPPKTIRR
jgi:hypothetical protein